MTSANTTTVETDQTLRQHLRNLLTKPQAHALLDDILKDFPLEHINERPGGLPYSAYEVLWHLRFAQRDILDFSEQGDYHPAKWPAGYWPHTTSATTQDWQAQADGFHADLKALVALLDNPATDLLAIVPHGSAAEGQTYLREFLLVADHNAYHLGQLALLKRLMSQEK